LTSPDFIIDFLVGFIHLVVGHNLLFSSGAIVIMAPDFPGAHGVFLVTGLISRFVSTDPPDSRFNGGAVSMRIFANGLHQ